MKTVTYAYVLQRAAEMTGRVYSTLSTEEATMFRGFIATSLRHIWDGMPWPDLMTRSQEFFAPTYVLGETVTKTTTRYYPPTQKYYQSLTSSAVSQAPATIVGGQYTLNSGVWAEAKPSYTVVGYWTSDGVYNVGDLVRNYYDNNVYVCVATNGTSSPESDTAHWVLLSPFFGYVSRTSNPDGTDRTTEIGTVFGTYLRDPRVTLNQPVLEGEFLDNGILFRTLPPYVWIEYRPPAPLLASDPTTIPYVFSEYCAFRAAAMMLRADGKIELGDSMLVLAQNEWDAEADKVTGQESQVRGVNVMMR